MKSFYEMLRILEGAGWDGGYDGRYDHPPKEWDHEDVSIRELVLGEDEEDPFHLVVDINSGEWECTSDIWVRDYVLNGSENPLSRPKNDTKFSDQKSEMGATFENPGKGLELLPASIRNAAIDWVDKKVQKAIENYDPSEGDPRNHEDYGDPNW